MIETITVQPLTLLLQWKDHTLKHIDLTWMEPVEPSIPPTKEGKALTAALKSYLSGQPVKWPPLPLDLNHMPSFSRRVLLTLQKQIGWGKWTSYGALAQLCGSPGSARAVGTAMRNNPFPLIIPCHRVLGSNGQLTGFGSGLKMKEFLLTLEGVWPLAKPKALSY